MSDIEITSEEFIANAVKYMKIARGPDRVVINGADGTPSAIINVPEPEPDPQETIDQLTAMLERVVGYVESTKPRFVDNGTITLTVGRDEMLADARTLLAEVKK